MSVDLKPVTHKHAHTHTAHTHTPHAHTCTYTLAPGGQGEMEERAGHSSWVGGRVNKPENLRGLSGDWKATRALPCPAGQSLKFMQRPQGSATGTTQVVQPHLALKATFMKRLPWWAG